MLLRQQSGEAECVEESQYRGCVQNEPVSGPEHYYMLVSFPRGFVVLCLTQG